VKFGGDGKRRAVEQRAAHSAADVRVATHATGRSVNIGRSELLNYSLTRGQYEALRCAAAGHFSPQSVRNSFELYWAQNAYVN